MHDTMEHQAEISIIMPCYNAQLYLRAALASLKAQTEPGIEMILIDDGSTDETGALLDRFAQDEPRARVAHTANRGVSAARNHGLSLAAGRYIAFMDADDLLEADAIKLLHRQAVSTGAQIVAANHSLLDMESGQRQSVVLPPVEQKPEMIVREILHMHRIYNNIWNKLYERSLFDGLLLHEGVRIGEDALLNLQLYLRAERVAKLPDTTYVYRVHGQSAMASIRGYSEAHQPMLRGMNAALLAYRVKETYFRDFLQSCVWIDEKERGIVACMRTFGRRIRPLALEGLTKEKIPQRDRSLYTAVKMGLFPLFYMLMRVREKMTGKKWGIRR